MKAGLFPLVSRVGGVCRNIERGDFRIEGEEEGRRRFPSVFSCPLWKRNESDKKGRGEEERNTGNSDFF